MNHTGPTLLNGPELAKAASEALSADMKFEDISEYAYLPTYVNKHTPYTNQQTQPDAKQSKS